MSVKLTTRQVGDVTVVDVAGRITLGEGFDFSSIPDPLAPENLLRTSGRGIFLIRSFMDDFQMRRLESGGTEVTLVKNLVSK